MLNFSIINNKDTFKPFCLDGKALIRKEHTMVELKFDCKETEDYYWKMRKNLGIGRPSKWNNPEKIITMEDVEKYVKDAKNILSC